MGIESQYSHCITAHFISSACARNTQRLACSISEEQATSEQPPYGSEQPPYVGKWIVGVESIPTSVHKAFVSILAKCMRTVSQTSHNITAPSLPSPLARTTQKLASISGPATSEVPTYVGEWLVEVKARQTIVTQDLAGLYGGIGSVFSQHSHSITAHFISSATIVTQACVSIAPAGICTVWQHSLCITSPPMPSPHAGTTQRLAISISGPATSEGATYYIGRMVSLGGNKASHCYPGLG